MNWHACTCIRAIGGCLTRITARIGFFLRNRNRTKEADSSFHTHANPRLPMTTTTARLLDCGWLDDFIETAPHLAPLLELMTMFVVLVRLRLVGVVQLDDDF